MSNVNASTRGYSERLRTPQIWRNTGDSSRLNFHIVFNSLLKTCLITRMTSTGINYSTTSPAHAHNQSLYPV